MKRFPYGTIEPGETGMSRQYSLSGAQLRTLALPVVLGAALFIVFLSRLVPAYSDDGHGVEDRTFESPIIIWRYPSDDKTLLHSTKSTPGDLLINGDMDQMGFYWRYPNHYIAGGWFEWFSTRRWIPEYTYGDKDIFKHTPPGSQRIHAWANSYTAGLMQSPNVAPCAYYRFQAFGHSRPGNTPPPLWPAASHMKVGVEPYGWMSGRTIPKYDPGLEPEEFPDTVVWSPEATNNFSWASYEVMIEALSDTITVILFSNPEVNPDSGVWWNDTLWDTASLVQVQPPSGTLLDDNDPPEPDGLITNVSAKALPHTIIVEWDTSAEASTQLLYRAWEPSGPVTPTTLLTVSVYLPVVAAPLDASILTRHSPPDTTPVYHHRVLVTGLPASYNIDFVALSRRLQGNVCATSASGITHAESLNEGSAIYLPMLWRGD